MPRKKGQPVAGTAASAAAGLLAALAAGAPLPFVHDPDYTSPIVRQERDPCMC